MRPSVTTGTPWGFGQEWLTPTGSTPRARSMRVPEGTRLTARMPPLCGSLTADGIPKGVQVSPKRRIPPGSAPFSCHGRGWTARLKPG
ncbi:hypothetical protein Thermus77412_24110 [Thermus antranikianii]